MKEQRKKRAVSGWKKLFCFSRHTWVLILAQAVILFGFPLLSMILNEAVLMILGLLVLMPVALAGISFWYGLVDGWSLWPSLGTLVLFSLSVVLFYNGSAWTYGWIYTALCLVAEVAGALFHPKAS